MIRVTNKFYLFFLGLVPGMIAKYFNDLATFIWRIVDQLTGMTNCLVVIGQVKRTAQNKVGHLLNHECRRQR